MVRGWVTAENDDKEMNSQIDKGTYASAPLPPRKKKHPGFTLSSLRLAKSLGSMYLNPSPALEQSTLVVPNGLTVVVADIVHINTVC